MDRKHLLEQVVDIARNAGSAIMEIYESDDFGIETKQDASYDQPPPLTKADKAANDIIEKSLAQFDYPTISEEGNKEADSPETFWLVDPLDGTKEFIKRNGEFTVNIGLIERGKPVLGVVYAPATDVMYYAAEGIGAYKVDANGKRTEIKADFHSDKPIVAISRSHQNDETIKFMDELGDHEVIKMGSSLKLCLVAEGEASVYPRMGPTYLWDTAAADAVVRVAGGSVRDTAGNELLYNPRELLNPAFIARTQS